MAQNRDNFTKPIIDILRRRAGNACSNPACLVQTVEPQYTNPMKVTDTGIAAHICAASPGGPRYSSTMTVEKRKDISNGIWLCSHCATKIDREPDAYSVDLLLSWKVRAEARIISNSNSRMYTESEAIHKSSISFLQNHGLNLPHQFQLSLSNISKSIKEYIGILDPRLEVDYSFTEGIDHFKINLKDSLNHQSDEEPIRISFTSTLNYKNDWENLVEHGENFTCKVKNFRSNSLALDILFPQNLDNSFLTIKHPNQRKAEIEIQDSDGNCLIKFEDFLIVGRSTFSIRAKIFDDLLCMRLEKISYRENENKAKGTFNLDLNFKLWDQKPLDQLNHFSRIFSFYKNLSKQNKVSIVIYIDGREIYQNTFSIPYTFLSNLLSLLTYTSYSQIISRALKLSINFDSKIICSDEEFKDVIETGNYLTPFQKNDEFSAEWVYYGNSELPKIPNNSELIVEQSVEINLSNMFFTNIEKIVYVKHIFQNATYDIKPETSTENLDSYQYKLKVSNLDKTGIYKKEIALISMRDSN